MDQMHLYIHSACCGAHWEIGTDHNNKIVIACEKCGKKIEPEGMSSLEYVGIS